MEPIKTTAKESEPPNGVNTQGAHPPPFPLRVAKAGRNHLNKEITPILPTGIGQTIPNLGHADCGLPQ